MDVTPHPAAVRVSVSELARLKNISQPAITKRLRRLLENGLIEVEWRGREKTVSLAEWDTVTGEVTDPAKLTARETAAEIRGAELPAGEASRDPTYTKELTRKAGYDADLKKIEIDKQRGRLLEIDDVRRSMERCAEAIVRDIGQLSGHAEDVASAVGKNGAAGAREILKRIERQLRETLERSMALAEEEEGERQAA